MKRTRTNSFRIFVVAMLSVYFYNKNQNNNNSHHKTILIFVFDETGKKTHHIYEIRRTK